MHIIDNLEICGVYFIRNRKNGCVYIGCSSGISLRIEAHERELRRGCHHNERLQIDFNTYGTDAFEVGIIQELLSYRGIRNAELAFIRAFESKTPELLYNSTSAKGMRRRNAVISHLTWLELINH